MKTRPSAAVTLRLLGASQRIESVPPADDDALAFTARLMVLATLPQSDPGPVPHFARRNGDFTLAIQPGYKKGLPYGCYPRLILAWLTTEVVRTQSRRVLLGESLSGFMSELGLIPSGGEEGTIGRLRDQMSRLFSARVSATYEGDGGWAFHSVEVTTEAELWWDPKRPDQADLFGSYVVLGERLFKEIVAHPVPLDARILRAIKRSPLALDLYAWLTYRVSYLRAPVTLSWVQVSEQFGADYSDTKAFARNARSALRRISLLWPELRYTTPRGRLRIYPSEPSVKRLRGS